MILRKFFLILALVALFSSCLKDSNENNYSPEEEARLLEEYFERLEANGIDVGNIPEIDGIYQIELDEGTGDMVMDGDSVGVEYTGFFLSGEIFDSSTFSVDEIYRFKQEQGTHIAGFYTAVSQLNLGARGVFLLPSNKAYGVNGSGNTIPPYTPILFEITLVDIYEEDSSSGN